MIASISEKIIIIQDLAWVQCRWWHMLPIATDIAH